MVSSSSLPRCLATLLLSISTLSALATPFIHNSRLRLVHESFRRHVPDEMKTGGSDDHKSDLHTFFYDQMLDHFSFRPESYTTFKHKYVINFKYWGGPNSSVPIFVYLGDEAPISGDIPYVGFLLENAPQFKALIVYIEHRFYGESIPYGLSLEEALKDAETRGYFNSAQALADYAEILIYIKQELNAKHSPTIVIGGSYGGMLATWFRLKYPHIALGALAASAPVLLLNNYVPHFGYFSIVSKDFQKTSMTCYETMKASWHEINRVASKPDGLTELSETFNTCRPLQSASELKDYLISLSAELAQYNDPVTRPLARFCDGVDSANNRNSSVHSKLFSGLVAVFSDSSQDDPNIASCFVNPNEKDSQTTIGWNWQLCSEMVYSFAISNDTMFEPSVPSLEDDAAECNASYGVVPRPNWVSAYYGGQDMKSVLQNFGSNIIFSNGLVDPYSNGGVLGDLSRTVRAVYTVNGSHCLDLYSSREDDPDWLVNQRKTEIRIIRKWIRRYNAGLKKHSRGTESR